MKTRRAMLVYQGGLANVFNVDSFNLSPYGRNARRIYQGAFGQAIMLVKGMALGGYLIRTAGGNYAGDITNQTWTDDLESLPFSDQLVDIQAN